MGLALAHVLPLLVFRGALAAQQSIEARELGLEFQGGKTIAWHGPKPDGAKLLADIAAARVAMDVEGDLAAATTRLAELSLQALAAQGFERQAEALVQAALARAELQQRLGDPARAAEELRQVVPTKLVLPGKIELAEPSPALLQALHLARNDARVTQALAALERRSRDQDAPPIGGLDALVDEQYEAENYDDIVAIGFPAFERFAERVLAASTEFPTDLDEDPLQYLIALDERRAARFLAQNLEGKGPLWWKRILRAMTFHRVLENEGSWTNSRPFVCLEPDWLVIVERLLGEREAAAEALPFFTAIERRDGLTDGLNAAFVRALTSYGPDFATLAMQAFDHDGVVSSAQPALEAALGLPDARLRRFAARKLVNFARSEALLARAEDPDLEVRRCVVQALEERTTRHFLSESEGTEGRDLDGRVDQRDSGTVRTLLADEDAGIRQAAVDLLDGLEKPLSAEDYLRLCSDPSPGVRKALAGCSSLPAETRGRVLALLARDPVPQVTLAVDNVLDNDFQWSGSIASAPGPFLEAIEARWKDETRPMRGELREKMRLLLGSAEGTRALVSWMLAAPKPEELKLLEGWAKPEALLGLPDELLARLLATSDAPRAFEKVWSALRAEGAGQVERPAAMRLLLADEQAPRRVRLSAARLAADEGPLFRPEFLGLLRDPSWKSRPPDEDERKRIRWCGGSLEPAARNALALEVLRDAAIPFAVADALVSTYRPEAQGGRELAEAILARWLRPGAPRSESVAATLYRLGQVPGLARLDRLEPALELYSEAVLDGIGELADPQFLPLMRRAMRAEWLPYDERDELQEATAWALGSFDEDEAVELLLEGLRSNDDDVRGACLASLERIKAYRGQVELWQGRARATPTKEGALGELLALLSDADPLVRKEAARGLGALGAAEALPDLIRALKDADAAVRAAAQASIERLNAAPGGG